MNQITILAQTFSTIKHVCLCWTFGESVALKLQTSWIIQSEWTLFPVFRWHCRILVLNTSWNWQRKVTAIMSLKRLPAVVVQSTWSLASFHRSWILCNSSVVKHSFGHGNGKENVKEKLNIFSWKRNFSYVKCTMFAFLLFSPLQTSRMSSWQAAHEYVLIRPLFIIYMVCGTQ